jgi:hypothetical protein
MAVIPLAEALGRPGQQGQGRQAHGEDQPFASRQ